MISCFAVLQVGGSNLNLTSAWWMFAPQIQGSSPDLCHPLKLSHLSFCLLSSFSTVFVLICLSVFLPLFVCLSFVLATPSDGLFSPLSSPFMISLIVEFLCWYYWVHRNVFVCSWAEQNSHSIHPLKLCFGLILDDRDDLFSRHHGEKV